MSNISRRTFRWVICLPVLLGSVAVHSLAAVPDSHSMSTIAASSAKPRLTAMLLKAPMSFEANQGQTDLSVNFIARGSGYTLFLTPTESIMILQQREATAPLDNHDPLANMEPAPSSRASCG